MARDMSRLKGKIIKFDNSSSDDDNVSGGGGGDNNSFEEFGLSLEKLNLGPKKKLLVLGLGGLLCSRVFKYDSSEKPKFRHHDASYGNQLLYKRPYCEGFIKFCLERFEVAIWSSAKEYNVENSLDCIMKGLKSKLVFAWGQEKCTDTGFGSLEKEDKPLFLKELKKVWQNNNAMLPNCKGKFNPSNTLLLDNKPYKALLNPENNGIFIDEYKVDNTNDNALGPKRELRSYLNKLVEANDVPNFVKDNPFGQIPINPKHPQWNYYSKVVRKLENQKTVSERCVKGKA